MSDNSVSYTVWVGGSEATWTYLTHVEAIKVAEYWRSQGYDDVAVVEIVETGDAA